MKEKTKIGFVSLGCPKNQLDTEVMLHDLMEAGYEITGEDIDADIIIVNTCAFIESAKQESIDNILDVAWLKTNGKLKGIVVTGCLAERYRSEVMSEMPEVDALLGVGSVHDIVDAVKAVENGENYQSFKDKDTCPLGGERIVTTPEYTAYLKIAEGCDNRCTYCAIPNIRGKYRSRLPEDIVDEAKQLEKLGVRELVLVAQDTSRWGFDLSGKYELPALIREICAATNIPWIRLLYCYPDKITGELIAEIRDNPRVVKYIDLPIQHISENVLRRMNRHGGSVAVREAVAKLRESIPGIIIRTTAIVGFPGESEEDFGELCEYIRESRFDRFGAFTYSREEGTPAADFDDQLDEQTKQDRMDKIMSIQLEIVSEENEKKVGSEFDVICEGFDAVSEAYFGRSYADAPEIDGKIYFTSGHKIAEGQFVKVKITETLDYDLVGEVVSQS
ncbi:MAG: 30S ribosomal protein S12 methylthiotransferase RimO [Eubacteriales bacterium]